MSTVPTVIVGAGPYGLAVAAHLRRRNVPFRIFGEPMRFWLDMPPGLFLKSFGFATTIANPERLAYDAWCREHGLQDREPCSTRSFADYGLWLQRQLVPEVEPNEVLRIEQDDGGYRLELSGGEKVEAQRVVIAVGLRYYTRIPQPLVDLPRELLSHTSQRGAYDAFAGKDVCVIGAGQSALEAAVLLHEAKARPVLVARGPGPIFHGKMPERRTLLARLKAPLTVFGPGRLNWVLQHLPSAMRWVPEKKRIRFSRRYLGPAGAWWIRERFEGKVPVRPHCEVIAARAERGKVLLRLRNCEEERDLLVDHVIAGTGFEVDVDRLRFLSDAIRGRLRRIERAPRVDGHFQSSLPGLYFVGVTTMFDFGPLLRFVAGTSYCAPIVARHVARSVQRAPASRRLALQFDGGE